MYRKTVIAAILTLAMVVVAAAVWRLHPGLTTQRMVFFPLEPGTTWTYRVNSESQRMNYIITDHVVGEQFIGKLNRRCAVVDENYEIARGGIRPVLYYSERGYLSRMSGLEYVGEQIEFPVFAGAIEAEFLPMDLIPNRSWNSPIQPYGDTPQGPTISQSHRSFAEAQEIVAPAGHFTGCVRIETEARFSGGSYKEPLTLSYLDWYAPRIGLVKTLAMEGGFHGTVIETVELLKFEAPRR